MIREHKETAVLLSDTNSYLPPWCVAHFVNIGPILTRAVTKQSGKSGFVSPAFRKGRVAALRWGKCLLTLQSVLHFLKTTSRITAINECETITDLTRRFFV